jgi:hypothetical protein
MTFIFNSWDTNNGCLYSGKKQRMIFSDSQCARLREAFTANPYLSKVDRGRLAVSLDLAEDNVSVRFFFLREIDDLTGLFL